jgi:hypothetical protein
LETEPVGVNRLPATSSIRLDADTGRQQGRGLLDYLAACRAAALNRQPLTSLRPIR